MKPDDSPRELAQQSNAALAEALRHQDPIWCDPAMVDLLAVATAKMAPVEEVQPWHLPYPDAGIIVLAKPLPVERRGVRELDGSRSDQAGDISAITWERPYTNAWLVRTWCRVDRTHIYKLNGVGKARFPDLRPSAVLELLGPAHLTNQPSGRILRALTALSRSSNTVGEKRESGSKAARKAATKAKLSDPRVRRLYLHRPATGLRELQALRDERAGSPRGHWVRGHWRHQWFPSIQEHHWLWIEGFPRGDFSKGIVSGERIQMARGP